MTDLQGPYQGKERPIRRQEVIRVLNEVTITQAPRQTKSHQHKGAYAECQISKMEKSLKNWETRGAPAGQVTRQGFLDMALRRPFWPRTPQGGVVCGCCENSRCPCPRSPTCLSLSVVPMARAPGEGHTHLCLPSTFGHNTIHTPEVHVPEKSGRAHS